MKYSNIRDTNISKYMQILSDDDMVNVLLSPKKYTEAKAKNKDSTLLSTIFKELKTQFDAHTQYNETRKNLDGLTPKVQNKLASVYREMSIKVFQSLTVNTDFTHNILNYYYQETSRLLSIGDDKITIPADIEKYTECIVFALSNSIKVIHANYQIGDATKKRTLEDSGFGIKRQTKLKIDSTNNDQGWKSQPGAKYPLSWKQKERFGQLAYEYAGSNLKHYILSNDLDNDDKKLEPQNDDYKTATGIYEINTIVDYKVKGEKSRGSDEFKVSDHLNKTDTSGNIKVRNDSKDNDFASSLSYILLNNPSIRAGTKNSLELATFLNSLSTIELSKCLPFLEVKLMLPSEVETSSGKVFQTSSVTSFLDGTPKSSRFTTSTYKTINASFVRKPIEGEKVKNRKAIETNMAVFTMPQTANNFNETYTGHYESFHNGYKNKSEKFSRNNIVQDITKPFLTVKSFNIDVAPTKGLMSFKSGRLSLVLHDKSRLADIAPFIKPDLFGSFGAEIAIKYGWTHIDALNKESKDSKSAFGDFLQENRVYEKYIITNSSYNMDANGQVNIDLSIAMKGPIGIRAINFELDKPKQITSATLQNAIDRESTYRKTNFTQSSGVRIGSVDSTITQIKNEFSKNTDANSTEKLEVINALKECFKGDTRKIKTSVKADLAGITHAKKVFDRMFELGYLIRFTYDIGREDTDSENEKKNGFVAEVTKENLERYNKRYAATNETVSRKNLKVVATLYSRLYKIINAAQTSIGAARGKQKKSLGKLVDKIMNGLTLEDPFFDNLNFSYNDALSNTGIDKKTAKKISEKLVSNSSDNFIFNSTRGIDKKNSKQGRLNRFVTLGNILLAVLGTHLGFSSGFDEVQIISHTLNNHAGLAKNCNVSSLLVDRDELNDFLNGLFKNGGQYTLESLMTQIIRKFFVTRYCLNYGLRSLYKLDKNNNVIPSGNLKPDAFRKKVDKKIEEIHRFFDKLDAEGGEDSIIPNVKFVMPKVKLLFDTVTNDETNGEATILRISVIDQNDNPFESITSFMNKFFEKDIDSVVRDINKRLIQLKSIKKSGRSNIQAARRKYLDENKRLLEKLIAKGFLKEENGEFVLNTGTEFAFTGIKDRVKAVMPSITYGTHNSAIIEASVSTINEARLNTVYITRPGRNEQPSAAKVRFQQELPLRVLPSQVNISMFGCPFVNFAQMIFIDFETNTTVDNQYNVVGIKHDISPGKFTTSLTLAYGDAFGKFENIVDTINRTVVDVTSIEDAESKKDEKGAIKSTNEIPVLDITPKLEKSIDLSKETMKIIEQDLNISVAKSRMPSAFQRLLEPDDFNIEIKPKSIKHIVYDKDEIYYKIKKETIKDEQGKSIIKLIFDDIIISQKKMSNQNFYIDLQQKFKIKDSVENNGMLTDDQQKKLYDNNKKFIFGKKNPALEQILINTNIFSVLKMFHDIMYLKIAVSVVPDKTSGQSRKAQLDSFGILRYGNVVYEKDVVKDDNLIKKFQQRINLFNFKVKDNKENLTYSDGGVKKFLKQKKSKKETSPGAGDATAKTNKNNAGKKKRRSYILYTHTTLIFKEIIFTKSIKALDTDSENLKTSAKEKLIKPIIIFEKFQHKSRNKNYTEIGKKVEKDLKIEIDFQKLSKIFSKENSATNS